VRASAFLDETTDLLTRTPTVLRALLEDLPPSWGDTPDVEGGWRPRDVVGHLISAELDDWIPRARLILEHGTERPFEPFDRFAHESRDAEATLDELLDRFASLRSDSLRELAALVGEDDLDRRGRHPKLGEVTLRELLATWAVHDLDHVAQVFAGMAGSRDAAVGPWRAYLGILLRRDDPAAIAG
jgi:DinB superfamily